MKRFLLFFAFIPFFSFTASAQQYSWDFGLNLGASNYMGDIGGGNSAGRTFLLDMKTEFTRYTGGVFIRKSVFRDFSLKFEGNYVRIAGADSLTEAPARRARNLSFRTDIFEAALSVEYYFYQINDISRTSSTRIDFKSYLYAGFGVAYFNPQAYHYGLEKWFDLRPLMTEGIDQAYDEITMMIPYGAGFNFTFNKEFRLGLQISYRQTFTDYLDDISSKYVSDDQLPQETLELSKYFEDRADAAYARENFDHHRGHYGGPGAIRGNPDDNDGYLLIQLTASYVLKGGDSFRRARYNSIINRRGRF